MSTAISVENVAKLYRLGQVGTGSLVHDLNRWWQRMLGREDPYMKVGETNDRAEKGGGDYVYALRDISFSVDQGEVLGVIGKNGAGKSTLLKLLSRVTGPSSGAIKVKGRIASLLEVGTGFHPELTGRENIFLNGAILGMRKHEIHNKFDEIVEFSGCGKYIDTPVKRYSSGMYVRLAFAVAAHLESEILIVDEVLAVGDAEFQAKCLGKMQDVAGNGRTVLFVSHNMASISRLTKRCVVISQGTVSLDGSTSDAIDHYLSENRSQLSQSDDVSKLPRLPYGSGEATVLRLSFANPCGVVKMGEALDLRVTCTSKRRLPKVQFHMTIFSSDGVPVGTSSSRDSVVLEPGNPACVGLSIPNPGLAPGRYYCDISLISGARFDKQDVYEVLPNALYFEVSTVIASDGNVAHWNQAWGRMVLPDLLVRH